jgi:O-methyltransferase
MIKMTSSKKRVLEIGLGIANKTPFLKPLMQKFYKIFMQKFYQTKPPEPKFSGWGMTTIANNPWDDDFDLDVFRKSCESITSFDFTPSCLPRMPIDEYVHSLDYRHYFISFCANYAIKFAQTDYHNFVECGVNDGVTAFVALNELHNKLGINFKMDLYDSWEAMKAELLVGEEIDFNVGAYDDSSIEIPKSNLKSFENNIVYHKGFIPDTLFEKSPKQPESISYLSIDLNSSQPTLSALNFFVPKLVKGGIIIFDDYGLEHYPDTKNVIDEFFSTKSGILMKMPTGQAIYFHQ